MLKLSFHHLFLADLQQDHSQPADWRGHRQLKLGLSACLLELWMLLEAKMLLPARRSMKKYVSLSRFILYISDQNGEIARMALLSQPGFDESAILPAPV